MIFKKISRPLFAITLLASACYGLWKVNSTSTQELTSKGVAISSPEISHGDLICSVDSPSPQIQGGGDPGPAPSMSVPTSSSVHEDALSISQTEVSLEEKISAKNSLEYAATASNTARTSAIRGQIICKWKSEGFGGGCRPTPPSHCRSSESYEKTDENGFRKVDTQPLSTFSIDVDTASYSNARRFLTQNQLPPKESIRIEEMINYFSYNYPQPKDEHPFSVNTEVTECPWKPEHSLVRIGIKGKEIPAKDRPNANLVFLLDVSGSMNEPNKLPLVIESMSLLTQNLKKTDRLAIAVYAGATGLVLPSTSLEKKSEIIDALRHLEAGGSTNGGMGIQLAYDIAKANFIPGGINRVILCTDGDFNVGLTDQNDLIPLIEEKAKSGVFLSVYGFGMGNLKDSTLEKLADKGNGTYGYIDSPKEARRNFVEKLSGNLQTIAKDVKIQVEFNPSQVAGYRLIGYENRMLAAQDFNNDKIDAGEIGSGHTVTALYELIPVGKELEKPGIDPLKYQTPSKINGGVLKESSQEELLTVKLRYKQPEGDKSSLIETVIHRKDQKPWNKATDETRFAASVASFGMILRDSSEKGTSNLKLAQLWASKNNELKQDERTEFISLISKAEKLMSSQKE
jgi:Ca-activated chloride channel family protein